MSLSEQNSAVADPRPSPGAALRVARELRGWSVEHVAGQLKLSPVQVAAIEADAFDKLPGNTFVRGFVRNYARLLGLDAQTLLESLTAMLPPERTQAALPRLPQEDGPSFSGSEGASPRSMLGGLAAVAGLVLGALLVFWYMQQPSSPDVALPEASAPLGNLVAVTPDASAASMAEPASVASHSAAVSSVVAASRVAPVAASEPVIVISPASLPGVIGASVALGHGDLRIAAQADSWVQVLDADGNKLYSGLLKPGAEQVLGGKLPYSLKIGNAPNTRVVFRGKPVELASATRGEVATFELK